MLVFVYSDFCTFILKVYRDQWQEMVGVVVVVVGRGHGDSG